MTGCRLTLLLAHHKTGDTRQTVAMDTLRTKDTALMPEISLVPVRVTHFKTRAMAVPHQ
jgi:hypothetical protein